MSAADTRYWYVSIDADHDLAAATLKLSTDDGSTFTVDAEAVTAPPQAAGLDAPKPGLTRYWWRILTGPDQQIAPPAGRTALHGELDDTPEKLHPSWVLTT